LLCHVALALTSSASSSSPAWSHWWWNPPVPASRP